MTDGEIKRKQENFVVSTTGSEDATDQRTRPINGALDEVQHSNNSLDHLKHAMLN